MRRPTLRGAEEHAAHSRDDHHKVYSGRHRQTCHAGRPRAKGLHTDNDPGHRWRVRGDVLGQAIGWYGPDQNAGFIGAIVGAVIILLVWGLIQRARETT